MVAVTMVTIAGNAAVIAAIRRTRRFPAVYPLASLATADLLLGLLVLPIATARELFIFQPHHQICAFWSTMDVFCCTASILSLCSVGWERWSAITAPLDRARRWKRAKLFAVLVWPVAAVVAIPTALVPSPVHHQPGELVKACTVNTNVGYVFFSTFFSFYLPGGCMLIMYVKILSALALTPTIRKHVGRKADDAEDPKIEHTLGSTPVRKADSQLVNRTPRANPDDAEQRIASPKNKDPSIMLTPCQRHLDVRLAAPIPSPLKNSGPTSSLIPRQRQATQTIITLMSVFLVCWSPFFVMLPIDSICECVSDASILICTWLGYANSALDPLVYAAASPTVRRALHESLSFSSRSYDSHSRPRDNQPG